jgi:hypothetical protein
MASFRPEKASKSISSIHDFLCKWSPSDFKNFLAEYRISPSWNPTLPDSNKHGYDPTEGKIALYGDFFKSSNFSLPISRFCLRVLEVH